ncbi:MAG: hypothetical protein OXE52_14605 [Chloroflexi bacterium]|nr:hypothetical protein [Chloroflexota bacterium]
MIAKNPSELLAEMMDDFANCTASLLTVSQSNIWSFDRAKYGIVFAKLSRRLRTILAVDKEIAVIFSNFENQQMRTIFFARKTIRESRGRLDSNILIIVHKDRSGNEKLVDWGREEGYTVLPIYVNGNMPSGDNFERELSTELYSHDHFEVVGPVSEDNQFYGRKNEAHELARKLKTGQIRACLGIRKIGKTSIVNRIIKNLRYDDTVLCVMIDCSKDDIWTLNANGLMWSIAEHIREAIESDRNYVAVSASSNPMPISNSREQLTQSIVRCNRTVIIFLDEFDYISPSSPTAAHWKKDFNVFWRNFRVTFQELTRSDNRNLSLLVSGISSRWFSVSMIENVENAALAFIPEEYLSPLPTDATKAMIKRLSRASGIVFDEDARKNIATVAADMPYWVRKACSFIHRNIRIEIRPYTPNANETARLLREFVEYEGGTLARIALGHLFTVYPELESVALECSKGQGDKCAKIHLETLRRYGIITPDSDGNQLKGEMIKAGLALHLEAQSPEGTVTGSAQMISESESLDDWAENLAILNRKRNKLEHRLRETALGFLRYDSLHGNSHKGVKDRLLQVIPKERRAQLAELTSDEIVARFLWTDLTKLILKEWRLFDPVFSDKRDFEQNCDIINDRPDAHAKEIDLADFAMHRRALEKLSGLLDKKI